MRTKDLPQIPKCIDINDAFKQSNAVLLEKWQFGGAGGFARVLRRQIKIINGFYCQGFGKEFTKSGKDEWVKFARAEL